MPFILRNIKKTVLTTLALYFSAVTTPVLAQAAIIDAIMGGGGVVGTECVNGVVSPEYQSNDAITEFGPGTTLFVKDAGKTRLRKGSGNWNDGVGYNNDDKVVFSLIDGNNTNQRHYLVDGTDQNGLIAEFGDASGGTPSVPDGQGEYTMEFVPATGNSGGIQVLGTIYRATLEDSKWTCVQPGLVAPKTPIIQSANPQDNGATLVLSPDADQVIEQYTVQLSKPDTITSFEVPIAGGGTGTLTVEERSSERTVLSFVGSGITNGQTWTVKVKAENGSGTSELSNPVEFIPGATQCNQVSDWAAAANDADWSCIVDDKEYAYADFHILTTDGTDVCAARATYLPTAEGDNQGLVCSQTDTELRAIYNWDNGNRNKTLSWLVDVEQIGSRTEAGVPCGSAGETIANRCANQLNGGKQAFRGMVGTGGAGIRDLDTSNLDSFEQMFYRAGSFDQNLSGWNTANVTTIAQMFQEAPQFTNGGDPGINTWDTRKVTKMNGAFDRAVLFNHDLSGWDTSLVTDMFSMFYGASSFNGSVSSWNTSKVSKMKSMFQSAVAFNRDLSHFDVGLVTDMSSMFRGAKVFNQDISAWSTGNVSDMAYMFREAKAFNRDLSAWNVTRIARQPTDFFRSATGWTGTDPATNQPWCNKGQPRWGTDGTGLCLSDLNFDVSSEPMALVETGESVRFTVTFSNESENDVQGATLKFSLPGGTALNEAATPIPPSTNTNGQLTWTGITVPKGSAGGALVVTLDVPPSYTNSNLVANFVMEVSNLSVTATQSLQVVPGGEPDFAATLDAPNYALASTELTYQLSVTNTGSRDADNATVTLTWDQTDLVPFPSADNCSGSPLACSWSVSLAAEDAGGWGTSLSVTVPSDAQFGDVIDAELTVSDAVSNATDSASTTTTVDAQPDLALVLTSSPRRLVAPRAEVEMTLALKNVGTAPAKNVVLTLPTSTAIFASASNSGAASGDDVVWPAIATLAASDAAATYTATLTAGADDSVIQTQASVAGTTEGGTSVSDTSNLITLRVANEADPVLTAAFDPENFVPGKDIALTFRVANEGSALLNAGTLVVPLPKDTSVAAVPTGATCSATACTLPVAALAAGGSAAATVPLTVDAGSSLTRLAGAGALKPDTAGAFIAQSATATADLQITSDTKEPYEITIDPPAGSGCSLTSVSTQQDAGVSGVTLVRDELLNFSVSGCDPGTAVPVAITVQGDALPEGTVVIKADDSGESGAQITGATITGNTVRYSLTDNGSLDLDPDDGELRDPVAVAILGGSGIYVPFIQVPIPYWVLGLLAGLMGWLGFRRLSAA